MIGSRAGDPADLRICTTHSYIGLAPGLSVYAWDSRAREMPSPPLVRNGSFTEFRLAPNPTAAVFGVMQRRRAGSPDHSIRQMLTDARKLAIYQVDAPGVRIKDCSSDPRFAGGLIELRYKGELARRALGFATERRELLVSAASGDAGASKGGATFRGWATLDTYFDGRIAAVELPDDSALRSIRADWSLVASCPRLEALVANGALRFTYVGQSQVRLRDLLRMRDARDRGVGWRVACYLTRELGRDLFSLRNRSGLKDWLRFGYALLGAVSGLGSLSWLLSQMFAR